MTTLAVQTTGLRKEYDGVAVVEALDLSVPYGAVHGLLGPDDAGKTTTLRMLLGLTRPTAGEVRVLGQSVPQGLPTVIGRIGALVDGPRFSTSMTGRRNLELLARASGLPPARAGAAMERLGLEPGLRTPVRTWSPGARQRLGLAAALLREADLLMLDEPTALLDPTGTREVQAVLTELAASGTTVLLASAQLDEVQDLCGSVTVVVEGRAVAEGSVADLIGESRARTRVGVDDPDGATKVLLAAGWSIERDGASLLVAGHDHPEALSRLLAEHQIYVRELSRVQPSLEAVFGAPRVRT